MNADVFPIVNGHARQWTPLSVQVKDQRPHLAVLLTLATSGAFIPLLVMLMTRVQVHGCGCSES